jgi:chromosome segregation ATPase
MGFGLLKRVFGGNEQQVEEVPKTVKEKLETTETLDWLNSQLASEIKNEKGEFSSISSNLLQQLRDLQKNIQSIRYKSFEKDDRRYAAVNMIKDTWTKRALMSFSSYNREIREDALKPESMEFSAFRDLYHSTVRLINDLSMVPRQKIVLSKYFENESKKMGEIMQVVGGLVESMKKGISDVGALKNVDHIKKLMDQLSGLEHEIPKVKSSIESKDWMISKKEEELKGLEERITAIENKPEWKELDELEVKIKASFGKKDDIENDIATSLGSMKRVFKLYAHGSDSMDKNEKNLMEDLSHSPLKTFKANDTGALATVMKKLMEDIENGKFKLADKDRNKTYLLEELLKSDRLSDAKKDLEKLRHEREEAKKRKDDINVTIMKGESERSLEKSRTDLSVLKRDKDRLGKELNELASDLKGKKKEISDFVKKEVGIELEFK